MSTNLSKLLTNKQDVLDFRTHLGHTLYQVRKAAHVSQTELGKLLSLHQTAICRIEQGEQSLSPEELFTISRYFDTPVDALMSGEIDYWRIAVRFSQLAPVPKRYREHQSLKTRDVLPLILYVREVHGKATLERLFEHLKLSPGLFVSPDQEIGSHFQFDFLIAFLEMGPFPEKNFKQLAAFFRLEATQGFLHKLYQTQTNSFSLLQELVLNAHHYNSHFNYQFKKTDSKSAVLQVTPLSSLLKTKYLQTGDWLCKQHQARIAYFPSYIDRKPFELEETSCHFSGAASCTYHIKTRD